MNVENSAGLSCTSDSSSTLIRPPAVGVRLAAGRRARTPARRRTRPRPAARARPSRAAARPPTPSTCRRSRAAPPRPRRSGDCSTARRSAKSSSGSPRSSQYLNTSASTLDCVSFRPSTLASASGPNDDTVARSCAPCLPVRLKSSTGNAGRLPGEPESPARASRSRRWPRPAAARPARSPLTSERNTGTPAADSCSAISCSVLVLPVPVAPAISPWRFSIASGTRTSGSGCGQAGVDRRADRDRGGGRRERLPRGVQDLGVEGHATTVVTTHVGDIGSSTHRAGGATASGPKVQSRDDHRPPSRQRRRR